MPPTDPPSPSHDPEEALLLKVVLDHADNVEALLAAEIARREALERELIAAKEVAESANRAKSLFLAKVNHDLRNPLTAMLGVTHLLERLPGLPKSAPEWLNMLRRSGEQLNQLIDDLLDISRIEAGKMELALQPLNLGELIEGVAEVNRPLAAEHHLELRIRVAAETLPTHVIGDAKRLRRILDNLLGNAVKFTNRGWVELTVEALPAPKGTEHALLRFSVADSGCGIPLERISHLFAPFEQEEGREKSKGLGLGLTISTELVELMGGHIEVESRVGEGSRFWFDLELPLAAPVASPMPPPSSPAPASPPAPAGPPTTVQAPTSPPDSPCVLLVDDDPAAVELIAHRLEEAGLRTLVARDGLLALEIARSQRPDLILLDVQMPGWNGFETCRRLKRHPVARSIPVIFLSGNTDLDSRLEGFRAGGVDYIGKPFAEPEVLARVTVHLPSRRLYAAAQGQAERNGGGAAAADPDSPTLALVLKTRDLLMGPLADSPALAELAQAAGTNPTTLNQAYQRHFGMTVFEYRREQRLELAKRMLRESRQAIKVIALEVGYANSRDFSRAFKARLGVTPEEYREGHVG